MRKNVCAMDAPNDQMSAKSSTDSSNNFPGHQKPLAINHVLLLKTYYILRAIRHPLRHKILELIHQKGEVNVTQIYINLRLCQSVTSQHLAILRKSGFLKTRKQGKEIFYSIDYDRLKELDSTMKTLNS